MKRPKIVVVGSANTDMIVRTGWIPRPGETVLGEGFAMAAGGKGANQAVAAARAGGEVTFVARLGRDAFGDRAVEGYRRDRISVERIVRDRREPTGVALICVARSGENSIAVASGANRMLRPADVRRARGAISAADVLLVQLEIPSESVAEAVGLAAGRGVPVILNPAPARRLPRSLLRQVTVLTPNKTEAELLTGIRVTGLKRAAEAAAKLREQGAATVILTLGAQGAWVSSAGRDVLEPGFQVRPVDTTAAGDVFNGALAVAFGEGQPLLEAVRFANAAAAISVTKLGAQPSAPRRREILRRTTAALGE